MSPVARLIASLTFFTSIVALYAQNRCQAPLPAVTNGMFPNSCANSVNGSVCTAACRTGYTSIPVPTTTCVNGVWSSPIYVCQKVCIGMPTVALTGGTWPPTCNSSTRFLTYCPGVCNPGWTGSPRVLCANGWDTKVQGRCVEGAVSCSSKPPTVLNGFWPDSCLDSAVGGVCEAVCNMNQWYWYNRTGTPRVTCLSNGSWTAPTNPPFCEQGPVPDVQACTGYPCTVGDQAGGVTCNDLPPPALNDTNGRVCSCSAPGYFYTEAAGCQGSTGGKRVSAGSSHTCAVKNDGTVVCWGAFNIFKPWATPGQVTVPAGLTGVQGVSGGFFHTCAAKTNGTAVCWGAANTPDDFGQATVPEGLTGVKVVSAERYHTCASKFDGRVVCWGAAKAWENKGQATVPEGLTGVKDVSAGAYHTCAAKFDGRVVCWGSSDDGATTVPTNLADVTGISAGHYHTCAATKDGRVVCWGYDGFGQVTVPGGLSDVKGVAAGGYHTCALKADGSVVCWGYSAYHQLAVPEGLTGVQDFSAGGYHTCAAKNDGSVVCWGFNSEHQTDVPAGLSV